MPPHASHSPTYHRREPYGTRCSLFADRPDALRLDQVAAEVQRGVTACNGYVQRTAPWKLADGPRLDTVLYTALEAVRILCTAAGPIVPAGAQAVSDLLAPGCAGAGLWPVTWGRLVPGTVIAGAPVLYPAGAGRRAGVVGGAPEV